MRISYMSNGIINIIDENYKEYLDEGCLDLIQIKNICGIYGINKKNNMNLQLNDIDILTPDFKQYIPTNNKSDILKSSEFCKKYSFFVKIIYACLKIDVEIFNCDGNILVMKNNYGLIKSLEKRKKEIINDHINILKIQQKNIMKKIGQEYNEYYSTYISRINIIDKIYNCISVLLNNNVLSKSDSLLSLIIPFFYVREDDFIEEYGSE